MLYYVVIDLDREYFEKHGNFFPLTGKTCVMVTLVFIARSKRPRTALSAPKLPLVPVTYEASRYTGSIPPG